MKTRYIPIKIFEQFAKQYIDTVSAGVFEPNGKNANIYKETYQRFIKLYPSLTEIYQS